MIDNQQFTNLQHLKIYQKQCFFVKKGTFCGFRNIYH